MQKLGFSSFSVLSLDFENSLFLGLPKHYKNRGFSNYLCFLLLKEKKIGKNNDNWNLWICFLVEKRPFRDAYVIFLKKKFAETPIFIVFWGLRIFLGQVVKKGSFGHPPKKENFD